MKILLLAPHPFFQPRGTPIAVKLLLEVLSQYGHQFEVVTYHEGEDIDIQGVRIHRIPAPPGVKDIRPGPSWKKIFCDIIMFFYCLKIIRKIRFDLIHAVEESVFIALVMQALFGIPFVYDMDSSLSQQLIDKYRVLRRTKWMLNYFEKKVVRKSIGVVAVCKSLENTAAVYDPRKMVVRLEDISMLKPGSKGGELLRKTLKINGSIVMYVGNLERYQGIDLLLEGFKLAAVEVPDVQLVVIGGSNEDIQRYKGSLRKLGLEGRAHFIGPKPVSLLACHLEQADILVSPRIQGQNTPMKIYSYLDSGKPLLATHLPTHTQVLDDQIALLVQPEPQAMAHGMTTLLKNSALREKLACRAMERVRQEFSLEAFQTKLLSFYKSLEQNLCSGNESCLRTD